jgi:transcriptional regulator with XRE-family HTH domain
MDIHKKLLSLREKAGLSQSQAAARLGLAKFTYVRYEQGSALMNVKNFMAVCKFYGVEPNYLLDVKTHLPENLPVHFAQENNKKYTPRRTPGYTPRGAKTHLKWSFPVVDEFLQMPINEQLAMLFTMLDQLGRNALPAPNSGDFPALD